MEIQVDSSHYRFSNYVSERRWISTWQQLNEVFKVNPTSVLEIGIGSNIFKTVGTLLKLNIKTLDIDPDLQPDFVGSVVEMPFSDASFDCVCGFQILEHLPFDNSVIAFKEMVRVAKEHVIISLPDAARYLTFIAYFPGLGKRSLSFSLPTMRKTLKFTKEHYWEINRRGYPLKFIIKSFEHEGIRLLNTFRVSEMPYHRFFVFKKSGRYI